MGSTKRINRAPRQRPAGDREPASGASPNPGRVDRLPARIVHDLRTPLAVIQGYSHLLAGELPPETTAQARDYLATIIAHTNLLNHLIDSLVLVEQALDGQQPRVFTRCDLYHLLSLSIDEAGWLATEKQLALHVDSQAEPLWVEVDERSVRQALYNLLWHGIRHARPGSELALAVDSGGDSVCVTLCDPRCVTTTAGLEPVLIWPDPGTGQGLMEPATTDLNLLAAGVVAAGHRGRLEVFRGAGGGARVSLYLPTPSE